jgi:hypothetical protein
MLLLLFLFSSQATLAAVADSGGFKRVAESRSATESLGALPLSFEENQGQTDRRVKFLSRHRDYVFFLLAGETVLTLQAADRTRTAVSAAATPALGLPSELGASAVLRTRYIGANPNAKPVGLDALPGKSHYFMGKRPETWNTGIAHFAKVGVRGIYPGIDLAYYSRQGRMEYDFILAPGADPVRIRMAFSGMEALSIDEQGNLVLDTPAGKLIQRAPFAYQEGPRGRTRIAAAFKRLNSDTVGFHVAQYDTQRPLIIDPILDFFPNGPVLADDQETPQARLYGAGFFSTFLGGGQRDGAYAIAVDADGDAYITGYSQSIDFPGDAMGAAEPGARAVSVFVSKLNAAGDTLIYSSYFGGRAVSGVDVLSMGTAIAVDEAGQAYVTGVSGANDFPVRNAFQASKGKGPDGFVSKLNAAGDGLIYSTYLGGEQTDWGYGVAVDVFGHAYITGVTNSSDFPLQNPLQNALAGTADAFVSKLDQDGGALLYSTYLGGSTGAGEDIRFPDSRDAGVAIAVDAYGQAHVTGITHSSDFPTTSDAFQTQVPRIPAFASSAFVAKLNDTGDDLLYSTYLSGSGNDEGRGIALDAQGNAYISGSTASVDFPLRHPAQPSNAGAYDGFVAKLNPLGDDLLYSTYLGGADWDQAFAIAVDAAGVAHVAGQTESNRFPKRRAFQANLAGSHDAFVTSFDAGGAIQSSTYLGGAGSDIAWGIAEHKGSLYVAGATYSADFPTSRNAFDASYNGGGDAFVTKFGPLLTRPMQNNSVQFSAPSYSVMEGQGLLSLTVIRNGLAINAASVDYATVNGAAIAGADYLPVAGTLRFAPGERRKLINVPILEDYTLEGEESLSLLLSHATGGVALGDPNSAVIRISDTYSEQ